MAMAGKTFFSSTDRTGLDTNASDPLSGSTEQSHGTFTDVTRSAGLDIEMYGMGVAVGDYNNDGFPDISSPAWGRAGFFATPAKGLLSMRRE